MTTERATTLRQLIREYREARGLTQAEVARMIHIGRLPYLRIEANTRKLKQAEFDAICMVLSAKANILLREAGYKAFTEE